MRSVCSILRIRKKPQGKASLSALNEGKRDPKKEKKALLGWFALLVIAVVSYPTEM
jgi:hypothetical protein